MVRVDLEKVGVFDCRIDCFSDVRAQLRPVSGNDELCIGYLLLKHGQQDGKLWVNRYTCQAGGRVIPP